MRSEAIEADGEPARRLALVGVRAGGAVRRGVVSRDGREEQSSIARRAVLDGRPWVRVRYSWLSR